MAEYTVKKINGGGKIRKSDGSYVPLSVGMKITDGDSIITDFKQSVVIGGSDKSLVKIGEKSVYGVGEKKPKKINTKAVNRILGAPGEGPIEGPTEKIYQRQQRIPQGQTLPQIAGGNALEFISDVFTPMDIAIEAAPALSPVGINYGPSFADVAGAITGAEIAPPLERLKEGFQEGGQFKSLFDVGAEQGNIGLMGIGLGMGFLTPGPGDLKSASQLPDVAKTALGIGDVVKTAKKGNYGKIIEIGDEFADVYFVNKVTGKGKTVSLPISELSISSSKAAKPYKSLLGEGVRGIENSMVKSAPTPFRTKVGEIKENIVDLLKNKETPGVRDYLQKYFTSDDIALKKAGGESLYENRKLYRGATQKHTISLLEGSPSYARDEAGNILFDENDRMIFEIGNTDKRTSIPFIFEPVRGKTALIDGKQIDLADAAANDLYVKQAEEMMSDGMEPGNTVDTILNIKRQLSELSPEDAAAVAETSKRLKDAADYPLRYMLEAGVIDDDTFMGLTAGKAQYVPMKRVLNGQESISEQTGTLGSLKRRKGSTKDVQHIPEAIAENIVNMGRYTDEQVFLRNAVKRLEFNNPDIVERLGSGPLSQVGFRSKTKLPKDEIEWVENGQLHRARINSPLVRESLRLHSPEKVTSGLWFVEFAKTAVPNFFKWSKDTLQTGVTSTIGFGIGNLPRDMAVRMTQDSNVAKNPLGFTADFFKQGGNVSQAIYEIAARGLQPGEGRAALSTAMVHAGTGASEFFTKKNQRIPRIIKLYSKNPSVVMKVKTNGVHPVEILRSISNLTEQATRTAAAKTEFGKTGDIYKAALKYMDITTDFAEQGAAIRVVGQYVPFLSAAIGGGRNLLKYAGKDPVGFASRAFMAITIPSVALWALNHDKEFYRREDDRVKNTYWLVNEHLKIQKPWEIGMLMGSTVERFLDHLYGQDPEKTMQQVKDMLDVMVPEWKPGPVQMAQGVLSNEHPYFKGPIEPNAFGTKPSPHLRYNDFTSPALVAATDITAPVTDRLGISPSRAEYIIGSQFGTLGQGALKFADMGMRAFTDQPAEPFSISDVPVVNKLYKRSSMDKSVTQQTKDVFKFSRQADVSVKNLKLKVSSSKPMDEWGKEEFSKIDFDSKDFENFILYNSVYKTSNQKLREQFETLKKINAEKRLTPQEKKEFRKQVTEEIQLISDFTLYLRKETLKEMPEYREFFKSQYGKKD